MFTSYQVLTLLLEFVVTIVAVWGIVSKAQATLKADLSGSIGEVRHAHEQSLVEARQQFSSINESFSRIALQMNTILEGDVRELRTRLVRLETGQDEWTKTLRGRTHDLANDIEALQLAVELIKAGHLPPFRKSTP